MYQHKNVPARILIYKKNITLIYINVKDIKMKAKINQPLNPISKLTNQ